MGSVFRRQDSPFWWLAFYDVGHRRRLVSSQTKDELEAKKLLASIERKVSAQEAAGAVDEGPLTLERYATRWLKVRRDRGIASTNDDEARLEHALPTLGHLRLEEVRRQHVRDLMRDLMAGEQLAPRTILHVYAVLRIMFADALTEDLILATPCTLMQRNRELPKKRFKDPNFRAKHIFTAEEVELLLSSPRVKWNRKILYALEFLGGMRVGEVVERRWRDYEPGIKPLGRLTVATSYNLKDKLVKETKTEVVRYVPVHPTLARILAEWKLRGWAGFQGRLPAADDLIIPNVDGGHQSATSALKRLHEDLVAHGLPIRRQHDARRTFISLCLAGGATKDLLKWVTHGAPDGDQMDGYTTVPWATLSDQVSRLRIRVLDTDTVRLYQTTDCYDVAT